MKNSRITATTGALRGACLFLCICLLMLAASPRAFANSHVGRGDFDFYLDSASFRGKGGKSLVEIPVRIANTAVRFKQNGSAWDGELKLNILIVDEAGKEVVKESERFKFKETDAERVDNPLAFQLIIKEYRLAPGGYWLSYAIEDLHAPKISMVGLARHENKSSVIRRVYLNVPEIPENEPAFSDAWFVWDVDPAAAGVRKYRPNPARMYGLYRDTLTVYMELYLPRQMAEKEAFDFHTDIVNQLGETVKETRLVLKNPRGDKGDISAFPVVVREDVTAIPAGAYTLYFTFGTDATNRTRMKAGEFSVAWDMRTWEVPRREFLAEARFLLGDKDFKDFQRFNPGEQESRLDAMWKEIDPEPATSTNEAYERFLERLAYINAHYSEGGVALASQRGDVYLRYGPPDEVVQDVIPLNYETLAEAEKVVDDPYHPLNMSSSSLKLYSTPKTRNSFASDNTSSRYRPEDNTGAPYELWVYEAGGAPLLPRDRVQEVDGLRFLFVDRDGHGVYKLEKSSSISNK